MSMAALAASSAGTSASELDGFLLASSASSSALGTKHDASLKAYFRELKKVISLSDVLLQVLDARDPLGSRSLSTERLIRFQGKRIVLVLNKVDLVPQDNVLAWLKYLRNDFPTLAFKSSTQSQRTHLAQRGSASSSSGAASTALAPHQQTQAALGAQSLISLLKNYSRSLNLKTSLTVGIFGAPNVGKSSLINSLKRARVCSVASTPGHTKVMQGVMLDKHVRLLDCPGIVFADAGGDREHEAIVQLRNVIKVESVEDPVVPVQAILSRVSLATIRKLYNIEPRSRAAAEGSTSQVPVQEPYLPVPDPDAQDFLLRLALQRGRLGRGGIPDTDAMARSLLHDWNTGKIPFYTVPPKLHPSAILSKDRRKEDEEKMDVVGGSMEAVAAAAAAASQSEAAAADTEMAEGSVAASGSKPAVEESAVILSSFSEAFDLAGLLGAADAELLTGGGSGGGGGDVETSSKAAAPTGSQSATEGREAGSSSNSKQQPQQPQQQKTQLGKRRRHQRGGPDAPGEDETADEPAWKARQRHRAQSARSTALLPSLSSLSADDAAHSPLEGGATEHALSRASLKKARKAAKRRLEVERRDPMSGPGGLLDALELGMEIEDGEGDEDGGGGKEKGGGDAGGRRAAAGRPQGQARAQAEKPGTAASTAAPGGDDDDKKAEEEEEEEW